MNVYKVVAHMYWGGLGGRSWRSSFEFVWGDGGIDDPVTNEDDLTPEEFVFDEVFAGDVAAFIQTLSLTPVFIDRVTVSTWRPDTRNSENDPETYDAQEVKVFPIGIYGTRELPGFARAEDLETTLFVRREVLSGRLGRLNLRGVLHSEDKDTNAQGKSILAASSPVADGGATWLEAIANLSAYINPSAEGGLRMVMFGTTALGTLDGNMRVVQALTPAGITTVNLTKRNKAPSEAALVAKLQAKGYNVEKA